MRQAGLEPVFPQQFLFCIAEQVAAGLVDHGDPPLGIHGDHDALYGGEEALGTVALQSQRLLRLVQAADVASDAEHTDQSAVFIEHRRLCGFEQFQMPVGERDLLLVDARLAGGNCRSVVGAEKVHQFAVEVIVVVFADDIVFGCPDEFAEAPVAGEVDAVHVFQPDQVWQCLDQGLQQAALVPQRQFHLLSCRNVLDRTAYQGDLLRVHDWHADGPDPLVLACRAAQLEFKVVGFALVDCLVDRGLDPTA